MSRMRRPIIPNATYFITSVTYKRKKWFAEPQFAQIVVDQGNPLDEVIRDEDMYWQKVAYTLLNAWREGLVSDPLEPYPFSDLADWLEREGEEFLLDLFSRYKRWSE